MYIRDQRLVTSYETLLFWNKVVGYPPARLPSSSSSYKYDELRLENHGTFLATAQLLIIKSFVTDGTGKLTVSNGSRVDVTNFPQSSGRFACDLEILPGGSLYIYRQPTFVGPGSPTVVIAGTLDTREPILGEGKF